MVFAVLGTVLSIFAPKILQLIGNEIVEALGADVPIDMARVGAIAVWLIVLYVASALFNFIQSIVMSVISVNISRRMRNDLSDKINKLPLSYFDRQSFGDILSRVTNDVDLIGQTLNQSLSQLVSSFTLIVGIIIMMFTISWQLTLVELVSVPVSFLLVMIIVKISQKHFRRQQNALGDINGIVEEIYSSHNVVKVFNGQEKAEREFEEINKVMASSALKGQFLSGMMMPVMNTVANISYVLVCLVGGMMAIKNNDVLFITSIVAFISYGASGQLAVRGHDKGKHLLRQRGHERGDNDRGVQGGKRAPLYHEPARRLQYGAQRGGKHKSGTASAAYHCAGHGGQRSHAYP